MIIATQEDVTTAVLAEVARSENPRIKAILAAGVEHLHGFIRDARITEAELHKICAIIARLGQHTTPSHNEVVLVAGSLGVSALVNLLNNGDKGRTETTASTMGPFWRKNSPLTENGGSIVRSPTPGLPIFVEGWVRDIDGQPVEGAEVDIWHTSAEGFYENQDPGQSDMNLRGKFLTDARGHIAFRSVKPAGYPIPIGGPVGDLLRVQGRHNMRPAHIHFMIHKQGYKPQFSQIYSSDDPHLESDVQFGVTRALVGQYVLHSAAEPAPATDIDGPWYTLSHDFVIERGDATLPPAPISGKADGARPVLQVLDKRAN